MTDNRAVLRRFLEEAAPSGDAEAIAACAHPDAIFGEGKQLDEHREANASLAAAIGDLAMKVQDTVAEGDKVAARVTITGKHIGDFMGQPGSGKRFEMEEILIADFRDGRISRIWRVYDMYSLMRQLGALPS